MFDRDGHRFFITVHEHVMIIYFLLVLKSRGHRGSMFLELVLLPLVLHFASPETQTRVRMLTVQRNALQMPQKRRDGVTLYFKHLLLITVAVYSHWPWAQLLPPLRLAVLQTCLFLCLQLHYCLFLWPYCSNRATCEISTQNEYIRYDRCVISSHSSDSFGTSQQHTATTNKCNTPTQQLHVVSLW